MVVSLTNYMKSVAESEDPRKEILRWAGNTKQIHLTATEFLLAHTRGQPRQKAVSTYQMLSQLRTGGREW